MKKTLLPIVLALGLLVAPLAVAAPPGPSDDPMAKFVYPPDVVMKYQAEIGLEDQQRQSIKELIQKAQSKFIDAQFDLQAAGQKLQQLLAVPRPDEKQVLAQADKVMGLEHDVKKAQLTLLVRIKNVLTEAQQSKLDELRK